MKLTGKHILKASPSRVWEILMDEQSLAKVVPGVSSLERISGNSFKSTLAIKLGPVNGSFTGNLQLEEIVEQKSFTLKAQQGSKIGNANAIIKIGLSPVDDQHTAIEFDGDVQLSGLLASMGHRIIGGVSGTMTKQFFNNLDVLIDN
ncbi:MAG: carbon monoxide dehydrogenase subunit G [Ferruginibacter sp.]